MQSFKIQGIVVEVGEVQEFAGGFRKRVVVVDTAGENAQYPSPVPFTFKKDNVDYPVGVNPGDSVTVKFTVDGRKWDGPQGTKYFMDLTGWAIARTGEGASAPAAKPAPKPVLGCTAATAIEEWSKNHGEDKAGFAAFCKQLKPGKASKSYTIADWADVVNAIKEADAGVAPEGDPDDLPF